MKNYCSLLTVPVFQLCFVFFYLLWREIEATLIASHQGCTDQVNDKNDKSAPVFLPCCSSWVEMYPLTSACDSDAASDHNCYDNNILWSVVGLKYWGSDLDISFSQSHAPFVIWDPVSVHPSLWEKKEKPSLDLCVISLIFPCPVYLSFFVSVAQLFSFSRLIFTCVGVRGLRGGE